VVTPAEHLSDVTPPHIASCTMFKTGATLILRADATSETMAVDEMLDLAYTKLRGERAGKRSSSEFVETRPGPQAS
jgi:hypothetical protein